MNTNTKEKLKKLIEAIEQLAAGCILQIGLETTAEVMTACAEARSAIESDDTVLESK